MISKQSSRVALLTGLWVASLALTWHAARRNPEARAVEKQPLEATEGLPDRPQVVKAPERTTDFLQSRREALQTAVQKKAPRREQARPAGDPIDALIAAFDGSRFTSQDQLDQLARKLGEADIEPVLDRLDAMPVGLQEAVLAQWARLEPLAAMDFVAGISPETRRLALRRSMFEAWAQIEPSKALAYAESIEGEPMSEAAPNATNTRFDALFAGAAKADPDAALKLLARADSKYHSQIRATLRELLKRDPDRVIDWAEQLPRYDPATGNNEWVFTHTIIEQWAQQDPLAAGLWIQETMDPKNQRSARAKLGAAWAQVDPRGAADWASSLRGEQDDHYERVMDQVLPDWMKRDRDAALNWTREQAPSPQLDARLQNYVGSYDFKHYHKDRTALAESISDPAAREAAVEKSVTLWMEKYPDKCADYLAESERISEAQKKSLFALYEEAMKARRPGPDSAFQSAPRGPHAIPV